MPVSKAVPESPGGECSRCEHATGVGLCRQVTGRSSKATTSPGGSEMGHDDTKALKGHHASFQALKVRVIGGGGVVQQRSSLRRGVAERTGDHLGLPEGEVVARIISRVLGRGNHSEGGRMVPCLGMCVCMGGGGCWGGLVRGFPVGQLARGNFPGGPRRP